jgi:hypothetical protein
MKLDNTKIRGWKYLIDVFIKQYKYNINMALDRSGLLALKKGSHKSMQEYAQRWREKVAQVDPPLLEKESQSIL